MKNQSPAEENKRPSPPQEAAHDADRAHVTDSTTPNEEHGERVSTGRSIARGGHAEGPVPGAQPATPAEKATGG